jgi:hypothetical protein
MAWSRVVVLIAAFALFGCAEEIDRIGSTAWGKPDATAQAFQTDIDDCRRVANVVPVRYAGPASVAAERRNRLNDCMIEHGWTRGKITADRSKELVACKLPSVELVQRTTATDCINRFGKVR